MHEIKLLNKIQSELNNIETDYTPLSNYYVYVTFFENGDFYIGSRECPCKPEDDVNYFGSYKNQEDYQNGEKVILKTFSNENEMIYYETSLIQKFKSHQNCINVNSSPRVSSKNNNSELFKTTDLMKNYGFSSPTTLGNWCILSEVNRFKIGKFFYVNKEDKEKLDELSTYMKSGYGYEHYLKSKGKSQEEIKTIVSQIKGVR